MSSNNINNQKGFALIYAILLSGAVLTVGVILMNIITKQLIFSSVNRNSETSYYYAANSGRECLDYYVTAGNKFYEKKKGGQFSFYNQVTISCFDQDITMTKTGDSSDGLKHYYSLLQDSPSIDLDNNKIELFVTFNEDCLNSNGSCEGSNLEDRNIAVMKAVGYAGANTRETKRVAIQVQHR